MATDWLADKEVLAVNGSNAEDVIGNVARVLEWLALRGWVEEQTGGSKDGLGGDISSVERREAINWTLRKHRQGLVKDNGC